MFAFIKYSGKQFKVEEGITITVDKVPQEQGEEVCIEDICLVIKGDDVSIAPKGKVVCEVVSQFKAKKVLVFKQRPKKGYRRKKGHRQLQTKLLIKRIELV